MLVAVWLADFELAFVVEAFFDFLEVETPFDEFWLLASALPDIELSMSRLLKLSRALLAGSPRVPLDLAGCSGS